MYRACRKVQQNEYISPVPHYDCELITLQCLWGPKLLFCLFLCKISYSLFQLLTSFQLLNHVETASR